MFFKVVFFTIFCLFVSSCGNSEKEARVMLNQAIKDWEAGYIDEAESKFKIIEADYLDTQVATESIKERARRKEKYKNEIDAERSKYKRKGAFTKKVYRSLELYFQANHSYPVILSEINIQDGNGYLSMCEYKKLLFEYGYQLDCSKADKSFNREKIKYAKNIKSSNRNNIKDKLKTLNDFEKVKSTWGEKFNPSKETPNKGFYAYYIDTNNPNKVIKKETVSDVSINYIYDKFHNIKSQDFGGYWVGRINLLKKEVKTIAVSQSWSKTRLIIDGHIVYEGGSKKELLLSLDKGEHLIEVEYINNWHTTEFSVAFMDKVEKFSLADIKKHLEDNILGEYEIYYAGVYESSSKDLSVVLNVEKTSKQIVLFLSSYSPVKWHISNPFMTNIRAIVYGSYSPGTTIIGDRDTSVILLPSKNRIGSYSSKSTCRCSGAHFHCEGSSLLATREALKQLSEYEMTGFSGEYSASSLRVPQVIINDQYLNDQKINNQKNEALRETCKNNNNPDFEKIFDN